MPSVPPQHAINYSAPSTASVHRHSSTLLLHHNTRSVNSAPPFDSLPRAHIIPPQRACISPLCTILHFTSLPCFTYTWSQHASPTAAGLHLWGLPLFLNCIASCTDFFFSLICVPIYQLVFTCFPVCFPPCLLCVVFPYNPYYTTFSTITTYFFTFFLHLCSSAKFLYTLQASVCLLLMLFCPPLNYIVSLSPSVLLLSL